MSVEKQLVPSKEMESEVIKEVNKVESEMFHQLKHNFFQVLKQSEKLTILSLLPFSWNCKEIEDEFKVTNYIAHSIKKISEQKGYSINPKSKAWENCK